MNTFNFNRHFTHKETEVQTGQVTFLGSHWQLRCLVPELLPAANTLVQPSHIQVRLVECMRASGSCFGAGVVGVEVFAVVKPSCHT